MDGRLNLGKKVMCLKGDPNDEPFNWLGENGDVLVWKKHVPSINVAGGIHYHIPGRFALAVGGGGRDIFAPPAQLTVATQWMHRGLTVTTSALQGWLIASNTVRICFGATQQVWSELYSAPSSPILKTSFCYATFWWFWCES